jgi:mycoketide-CoA synthase
MSRPLAEMLDATVAVVGLAGRYPGARDVTAFWRILASGRESTTFLDDAAMAQAGVPEERRRHPHWVGAAAEIDDPCAFDAPFFGLSPREARMTDPQHRVFLECAWAALENAGYNPRDTGHRTGVFAGASFNLYLASSPSLREAFFADPFAGLMGVDKDFLATRVAYKLDLRGPAVTLQTACSTSLVAVHMACQSILAGECEMALAGGVSIRFPRGTGYLWQDGGILSPDGRCRAFDARGCGTVGGEGAGVVVLKRLDRALADGDHVRAVVRGSAVNNDGGSKVGYMAPSVEGQAEVIEEALAIAGVDPDTITCVEAHGTATALGDPIEVEALAGVFRRRTERTGYCAIGSVKTNVGHLDAAAGVASLTKAILALENETIPANVHFETPNPRIAFAGSPFFVPTTAIPWRRGDEPRRAGVSSFGVGGTNAHVVLEEAPLPSPAEAGPRSRRYVLALSAFTPAALSPLRERWAEHLEAHADLAIADVCFTGAVGRAALRHRLAVIGCDLRGLIAGLRGAAGGEVFSGVAPDDGGTAEWAGAPASWTAEAVAAAFVEGRRLDWRAFMGESGRRVPLPTYPFERHVYAAEPSAERRALFVPTADGGFLGRRIDTPVAEAQFARVLSASEPAWLGDHRVFGEVVVPAAFHLALMLAAAREGAGSGELRDVRFPAPLWLDDVSRSIFTVLSGGVCRVYSRRDGGDWERHAEARVVPAGAPGDGFAEEGLGPERPGAELFDATEASGGVVFGPAFRRVAAFRSGSGMAWARFDARGNQTEAPVDPAVLDGALQVLAAAVADSDEARGSRDAWLPIGVDRVWISEGAAEPVDVQVRLGAASADGVSGDLALRGRGGDVALRLDGLHVRRVPREALRRDRARLFDVEWPSAEVIPAAPPPSWRALCAGRIGESVASQLSDAGVALRTVSIPELTVGDDRAGVVDLRALDLSTDASPLDALVDATRPVLDLLRSADGLPVVVVTRGAQAVAEGDRPDAFAAAVQAAAAGAAAEWPIGQIRRVDLDPETPAMEAARLLARELSASEPAVAFRGGRRFVARLVRRESPVGPRQLEIGEPGQLSSLRLRPLTRRPPEPGEIEIEVRAAGLNFRDVLGALGMLPGPPSPLGLECAGVVTAVGSDVHDLAVGDSVLALAPGSLATHVTCPAWVCARLPRGADLEQAASIGGAFATARAALARVARAERGQSVLIHSAASGVGLATVAEARRLGLDVLATAGSHVRREWLRAQGIVHVFDSRSPGVAEQVLEATAGDGVDIVVAALAGDLIDSGLRALKPGGRYVELGKSSDAGERARRRPEVEFVPFDLGALKPESLRALLAEIADDLGAERLGDMPRRSYSFVEAARAFREMAAARHLGKIVLVPAGPGLRVRPDGAYLVTGGTGDIGLAVAEGLAQRGAGDIVLVGREEPSAAAIARVAALTAGGTSVRVQRADVSSVESVRALLASFGDRPLRGVVHAAGVNEDALIANVGEEGLRRTLAGKAVGALLLARMTSGLDFLVFLSSAAAVMPRPGQAAYAAANAVLDAVAARGRIAGAHMVSLRLGAVAAGMTARALSARAIREHGPTLLDPEAVLEAADRALAGDGATPVVLASDPPALDHPLLSQLRRTSAPRATARPPAVGLPPDLPPTERRRRLEQHVRARVGLVLGLPAAQPPALGQALGELGLDSLLALELRNTLAADTGLSLASTVAFDHPTIEALVRHLDSRMSAAPPAEALVAAATPIAAPALDGLSADEVASLLEAELRGEGR